MVDAWKKKQTITSTALRLGTFRLVFSGSFHPYSWNGQWHNRPLGSFDMSSPLETLVREVIRTADKNTSRVEICTVYECQHYPFFHCGSVRKALMKRNTSSVVGFIFVALYKTSNTEVMNIWNSIFELRNEELNVKKILAVINTTYAVAKRKPEKIRLAGITLHNSCSNENFKAVQQTVGTKSSFDNS